MIHHPLPGLRDKGHPLGRPVMQHRRVEIRTIRPDQGRCFRVEADLLKDHHVLERAVQGTGENRAKINRLFGRHYPYLPHASQKPYTA